jgi:urocanate hydratase (EC 4.2.1.49)
MVRRGDLSGPIWFGRDHLDAGSVASPFRETEGMLDGSDAVGDWPVLNYALNTAVGATWTCFHHGGGVGIGYAIHAGFGMVVDGTELAEQKAIRLFTVDPGMGVVRHAHAGYPRSLAVAREKGVRIPIIDRLEQKSEQVIEEAKKEGRASDYTYQRVKGDLEDYKAKKGNYRRRSTRSQIPFPSAFNGPQEGNASQGPACRAAWVPGLPRREEGVWEGDSVGPLAESEGYPQGRGRRGS